MVIPGVELLTGGDLSLACVARHDKSQGVGQLVLVCINGLGSDIEALLSGHADSLLGHIERALSSRFAATAAV
jgi:hypothetical protein